MPRCPEILGALFGRFEGRTRVDLAASSATLLLVAGVRSPPFFVFFRPVGPWDLISKQLKGRSLAVRGAEFAALIRDVIGEQQHLRW